jgi:NADPH-dependent stearoyl-CoA 9-desaturase
MHLSTLLGHRARPLKPRQTMRPPPRDAAPTRRELRADEVEAFGRELDELRQDILRELGARDVEHIRRIIGLARRSEALGRILLHVGIGPVSFAAGSGALALSKILDNMEIGHNVLHGQYDWTGDPALNSRRLDWDITCPPEDWRHWHNYEHHTFTNILGKDRDIGYVFLRTCPEQRWHPGHLFQPAAALGLALFFQWGIGAHGLRLEDTLRGTARLSQLRARAGPFLRKAGWQVFKEYAFYPSLALWNAPRVAAGNFLANTARNLWAFAIIFCGHFPEGVRVYREDEIDEETRGQWYLRQIAGSANIEGGRVLHVLSGHLSHQIEHHLFPDIPASRYPEIAERVRAICARYDLPYNSGPLRRQFGSVVARILRLSLPVPRPRPSRSSTSGPDVARATGLQLSR